MSEKSRRKVKGDFGTVEYQVGYRVQEMLFEDAVKTFDKASQELRDVEEVKCRITNDHQFVQRSIFIDETKDNAFNTKEYEQQRICVKCGKWQTRVVRLVPDNDSHLGRRKYEEWEEIK